MKTLFPPGLLQNLKNMEDLYVVKCEGMEEIIAGDGSGPSYITSQFSLPKLRRLRLYHLPRLTSICDGPLICEFLEVLEIVECEKLKKIPIVPPLPFLRKGDFGSTELLEQFKQDHPSAKDILQHVPYYYGSSWLTEFDSD
ncbi:hypothetical protein Tsubulata_011801 [Turnera subulata]|uniref:Disease resistance protein At4g27190-like leucine-rich repeats domain-containing protein n=1 Tax=Turnera subulata TaxID=218843 RepID=A0A9Q0FT17_9ROSI|nr:hypothetical protein Tsubulata_011801 [Turnera subulata]